MNPSNKGNYVDHSTGILKNSKFSLVIPKVNSVDLKHNGEETSIFESKNRVLDENFLSRLESESRDYLIQGELLRLYLLVRSPSLKIPAHPTSKANNKSETSRDVGTNADGKQEENNENAANIDLPTLQMGEQLTLAEFYKTLNCCGFEIDFVEENDNSKTTTTKNTNGPDQGKNASSRITDIESRDHKHTFVRPNKPQFTSSQQSHQSTSGVNSNLNLRGSTSIRNSTSMNSFGQNNLAQRNLVDAKVMDAHPNFFRQVSGDGLFIYPLEFPIRTKDEYLEKKLSIRVTVTPPSLATRGNFTETEEFTRVLTPFYNEVPPPSKSIQKSVKIIQPFTVVFDSLNLGNTSVINATVENKQDVGDVAIRINDVDLYIFDSAKEPTAFRRLENLSTLHGQFKLFMPKDELPTTIGTQDQQSLVFMIEPIVTPQSIDMFTNHYNSYSALCSKVVFTWSHDAIFGQIATSFDVPLAITPPSIQDMIITIQAESPVPMNVEFPISLTVTNLGDQVRDLTLIMGMVSQPGDRQAEFSSEDDDESDSKAHSTVPSSVEASPVPSRNNTNAITNISTNASLVNSANNSGTNSPYLTVTPTGSTTNVVGNSNNHLTPAKSLEMREQISRSRRSSATITVQDQQLVISNNSSFVSNMSLNTDATNNIINHYNNYNNYNHSSNNSELDGDEPTRMGLALFEEKFQNQPPLICLEKSVTLGMLKPHTTVSTNLRFVALQEGLHNLDKMLVHDTKTDKLFIVKDACQIFVKDQ